MTPIACAILGLGALVIVANWSLAANVLVKKKGTSPVPLFGGLLAFVGCALLPVIGWKLGLIAFVVDPGCWFFAIPFIWAVEQLRERR
jgi:hypothetical protein